jgi:hypothetical protein
MTEVSHRCVLDIRLYLTPTGQARQFIETCGTYKISSIECICLFLGKFVISALAAKKRHFDCPI